MTHAARIVLAEYAQRIRARDGHCLIEEQVYACEAAILESYRWIRCTRLDPSPPPRRPGGAGPEGKHHAVYRVALTRLGVREAAAIEADLGRR